MPPPPPPSASYSLVIEDSSSEEEEYGVDYHRRLVAARDAAAVHRTDGYLPTNNGANNDNNLPWAEASYPTVEATSVKAVPSENIGKTDGAVATPARRSSRKSMGSYRDGPAIARKLPTENEILQDNAMNDAGDGVMETDEGNVEPTDDASETATVQPPAKKKKRKKKKKKKKKPKNKGAEEAERDGSEDGGDALGETGADATEGMAAEPKPEANDDEDYVLVDGTEADMSRLAVDEPTPESSDEFAIQTPCHTPSKISFGKVSVREYARTLGTHVVPADGGWPLGLSGEVVAEHPSNEANADGSPTSSPRPRGRSRSNSMSSPGKKHPPSYPSTWSIDDFESRKQTELQERYIQLVREQRRRKFEKEWEKKHHHRHFKPSIRKNRGRSRSGSFSGSGAGGGGGGGSSSSGSMKMAEMSAEEKEELERLVNQPVDVPGGELETRPYDYKKKVLPESAKKGKKSEDALQHTEEEELYDRHGGRNPLFRTLNENDRRKVLLRDDHLMKYCQVINDTKATPRKSRRISASFDGGDEDESQPLDPSDGATTQHLQHDLETLRIQRSNAANLGCSCRKLHVFLPGATDKSHHKKKGSHRRLPERKIREELRKRGLLNKGDEGMSREKMEKRLHDAIEKEPCCWGNDCPCVRNGIGCQADTCSCWHASHDVAHGNAANTPKVGERQDAETLKTRCGNSHGMYVVDLEGIARYREMYVASPKKKGSIPEAKAGVAAKASS